MESKFTFKQ